MTSISRSPSVSYRTVAAAIPARPGAAEAVRATADLAQALRALDQLPRLMRAAGINLIRIDAAGRIDIAFVDDGPLRDGDDHA